ncbi:MAG: hypothetical protein KKH98_05630 [Spirochaetes bacterium]|nr:hypothetical protein [Spirochaetota bacterium]
MKVKKNLYLLFLIILLVYPAYLIFSGDFSKDDIQALKQRDDKILSNYDFNKDRQLLSRVKYAPHFVINAWKKWDKKDNYKQYTLNKNEKELVQNSLFRLPYLTRRTLRRRLIHIYFIENFLGYGVTDWVLDKTGQVYFYMIFNPDVLRKNISQVITEKEMTCFKKDTDEIDVKINCMTNHSGFLYILLHESTHAVDYVNNITPYVEPVMAKVTGEINKKSRFTKDIWEEYAEPEDKYDYKYRSDITYYGMNDGPKINISEAADFYKQLKETPFTSSYASLNWAEDLAEFVTFYQLTQKLEKPYQIKVLKNKKVIFQYEPMKQKKVKKRFQFIEKAFY